MMATSTPAAEPTRDEDRCGPGRAEKRQAREKKPARAFQGQADRQRSLAEKSDFIENRLQFIAKALDELRCDEDFPTLMRAEGLDTMPHALGASPLVMSPLVASHGGGPAPASPKLGRQPWAIERRAGLIGGICPEAADRLKDAPCALGVYDSLRRMPPRRQVEAANLMLSQNAFGKPFALAILAATPDDQLLTPYRTPRTAQDLAMQEEAAVLEQALIALQPRIQMLEGRYGAAALRLTVAKGYLRRLLDNARVVGWLARRRPDDLKAFQAIAELTGLPTVEESTA
jgi:hypothetical protein